MKRGNGFGGISHLSGNRRKKWYARLTTGWKYIDRETGDEVAINDSTDMSKVKAVQQYRSLGTFRTKAEAQQALNLALLDPYSIPDSTTFAEVYEKWSEEHFERVSKSSETLYKAAYKHCKPLYKMAMRDIKVAHLEAVLFADGIAPPTQANVKKLLNGIYRYALRHEIIEKDYAKLVRPLDTIQKSDIHKPFTSDEIKTLWKHSADPVVAVILIGIYSGWRPQELLKISSKSVDFERGIMTGGIKTKAGKDRIVPIHSAILPLLRQVFEQGDGEHILGKQLEYKSYSRRFSAVMERYGMHHLPHDTRHTFVSLAKEAGVDEYCLKLMTGHAIQDITERVYTHRQISQLKEEIERIKKEAED